MDEQGSDSDYSESSDDGGSVSTSSSSSVSEDDNTELARICKHTLRLPKGLCENSLIFEEFFSMETWKNLPDNFQACLKNKFLPHFPENNEIEQEKTLQLLFNNEITRFKSSQLVEFQRNLQEGNYRPDILKLRKSIKKCYRREQRFQESERISQLAKCLMISRERLLRSAYDEPPGAVLKVDRLINSSIPKLNTSEATLRARKRFAENITNLARQLDIDDLSDEEFKETIGKVNTPKSPSVLQDTQQNSTTNEAKIYSTMCRKNGLGNMVSSSIAYPTMTLNDNTFKQVLLAHKRRKLEEPDRPEFDTSDIRLRDVHARTQLIAGYRKPGPGRPVGRKSVKNTKVVDQIDGQAQTSTIAPSISTNTVFQASDNTANKFVPSEGIQLANSQQVPSKLTSMPPPLITPLPVTTTINNNLQPIINSNNSKSNEVVNIDIENEEPLINVGTLTPSPPQIPTLAPISVDENGKKRALPQTISTPKSNKKVMMSVNGGNTPGPVPITPNTEILKDETTHTNSLPLSLHYHGKIKAATLSDLEGIDMMHLPVDLDDSGHIDLLNDIKSTDNSEGLEPELMQDTHACFLSLIRDIFCSTPNHRMKLEDLKAKIFSWLSNPITALNDWYCLADNWLGLIPSAIHFLAGEFADQPEDFVPYIEFKIQLNIYQWIGAGRDSDQHLIQLCNYWLSRRNEMGSKPLQKLDIGPPKAVVEFDETIFNERPTSPPPPRCPTNWTVQPATLEEIEEFRQQEKQRFENPHKAFTFRMHGYESVVGPVKGIYTQIPALTKARGHNMLTADRPNFVTILTLVRDATARLPNGEGTRADICELLKSSQYLYQAQDSILQTIVSGALDRMHTEYDPCVRYDGKRKIWIYLHRNRSEEEFERFHQQFQGIVKHKKVPNRKVGKQKSGKITPQQQQLQQQPQQLQQQPQQLQQQPQQLQQQPQQLQQQPQQLQQQPQQTQQSTVNVDLTPSIQSVVPVVPSVGNTVTVLNTPTTLTAPSAPNISLLNSIQPVKVSPQKPVTTVTAAVVAKNELISINPPIATIASSNLEKIDTIEVDSNSTMDTTQTTANILQKTQQQQPPLQSIVVENKGQKIVAKKVIGTSVVNAMNAINATQVKVSTPTGIQTVHVSSAIPLTNINQDGNKTVQVNAPTPTQVGQTIIVNQNQNNSQNHIIVGNKKISKPILINPNQGQSLISQVSSSGQGYIIPININNAEQLKNLPSMTSGLITNSNINPKLIKSNQPPALTSTINNRQATIIQQGGKNFVRVAATTAQAGKSLINPHVAATNISLQQQQKLLNTVNTANIGLQQKITTVSNATSTVAGGTIMQSTIRPQIQKINASTGNAIGPGGVSLINAATVKGHSSSLTPLQQKQILQNIIQQQQKQRANAVNMPQNTVVIPSGTITAQQAQNLQTKNVIIPQQQGNMQQIQKIVNVSSAGLQTVAVSVGNVNNTTLGLNTVNAGTSTGNTMSVQPTANIINPQIIHIQGTGTKVQTLNTGNLTPQQQQNLLQNIKQQQIKLQTAQGNNPQTQSLIIKQQPIFQQIQKQQVASAPTTISVSMGTSSPKTVTPLIGTNVTNLIATPTSLSSANVLQHAQQQNIIKSQTLVQQQSTGTKQISIGNSPQTQTIARVIKSGGSIIQPQVISSVASVRNQSGNPVMAKVLTNTSGQIISLESLLQKQGVAPGTTLRVANAKPTQTTNLIQLAGSPGSQITQYAVVSQGRNLISVGTPQRLITTQAVAGTNTVVTSLGSNVMKTNEQKQTTVATISSPPNVQAQLQNQPKVITANQIQPITAQQIMNAKVLGKAGSSGIRMVNASNLNIAHIRGKPVIIASKPANVPNQQSGQNVQILQNSGNSTNLVIGGQTLKVQGNIVSPANVQVLNQASPSSQQQTVVLGNQILKVQQAPVNIKQQQQQHQLQQHQQHQQQAAGGNLIGANLINATNNTVTGQITSISNATGGTILANSGTTNLNQNAPKTVILGSTGQAIRVQSPAQVQVQTGPGSSTSQGQPMLLGTTVKGTQIMKGTNTGQQRVVLAVQGGGQILLPPGFQGGAINLKSLQGLKVVSLGQQQQSQQQQQQQLHQTQLQQNQPQHQHQQQTQTQLAKAKQFSQ